LVEAGVEEGVIGEDGADADEDGAATASDGMEVVAGLFAGEPAALGGGGPGEFGIEALGPFEDDEGAVFFLEGEEAGVQESGLVFATTDTDVEAGLAELPGAAGVVVRGGIEDSNFDGGKAGLNKGVGAGWGFALAAAGFEGDEQGGTGRIVASAAAVAEGIDLGVVGAEAVVVAAADETAVADEDGTDLGIGGDAAGAFGGQVQGLSHEFFTKGVVHGRIIRKGVGNTNTELERVFGLCGVEEFPTIGCEYSKCH